MRIVRDINVRIFFHFGDYLLTYRITLAGSRVEGPSTLKTDNYVLGMTVLPKRMRIKSIPEIRIQISIANYVL